MSHIKLMLITNDPGLASLADQNGVDRIFVDLEKVGKLERQGHLDTVISDHSITDILAIKSAISNARVLVRMNPYNDAYSAGEIEDAISAGADILMLPMFTSASEVEKFVSLVGGRVRTSLLLETAPALIRLPDIIRVQGIDEVHVGLNDLHLSLGLHFMFELLSSGIVDKVAKVAKENDIIFGFGGVGKIGDPSAPIPPEDIIKEHVRLGSEMVILSRQFSRGLELENRELFERAIMEIRQVESQAKRRTFSQVEYDRAKLVSLIKEIVRKAN